MVKLKKIKSYLPRSKGDVILIILLIQTVQKHIQRHSSDAARPLANLAHY